MLCYLYCATELTGTVESCSIVCAAAVTVDSSSLAAATGESCSLPAGTGDLADSL